MNIFGKKARGARKHLFLSTTILRGFRAKEDGASDGIDVGTGFAAAAEKMASDDTRNPGESGRPAENAAEPEAQAEAQADDGDEGDGDEGGEGDGDEGGEGDEDPKPKSKKRETAQYIRDLKRERRDALARATAAEMRAAALENKGSTTPAAGDIPSDTSGRPDPEDADKYPLGVLDDGYTSDFVAWSVAKALADRDNQQQQKGAQEQAETHLAGLKGKMETLADKGADQFDDFEEKVIEAGLKGTWKLTETTFTAAADAENGAAILHALANDTKEALRVSLLSPYEQLKYVAQKDGELESAKPKRRTKPGAGVPPADTPRGRNSSVQIRGDTDNLDDFRKLFYKK